MYHRSEPFGNLQLVVVICHPVGGTPPFILLGGHLIKLRLLRASLKSNQVPAGEKMIICGKLSGLKKILARIFLRLFGWRIVANVTPEIAHSVMVAAPHTSNWDFPIALAAFWYMDLDVKFFIKDDYTRGPFGWFFKWCGAIGVDRSKARNKLTDHAIELLKTQDPLIILVPAEGTRKAVPHWRTGFYRIAREAGVPISLGYLDYQKKTGGVEGPFTPSGDFGKDMLYIQEFYRPVTGKHPENYNPEIF